LAIDRFNAEVSYNRRGRVTLSGNLSTPYGKASVGGELLFDERYPERSTIRKFNLTVQNLSEELQEVLEEWELETGNSLPRKGRSIEINITGTLGEPLMDGKPLIERSRYEWENACDCVENALLIGTTDFDADLQKDCVDHVEGLEGEDKTEWQKEMLDCM
jgi:hypothetical protein